MTSPATAIAADTSRKPDTVLLARVSSQRDNAAVDLARGRIADLFAAEFVAPSTRAVQGGIAVEDPVGTLERARAIARSVLDGGAYVWLESDQAGSGGGGTKPLAGVTLAVKDNIAVAGHPASAGSRVRRDAPSERRDAAIVGVLRSAGAVVVGGAALHEFAFGVSGVNALGTPVNPRVSGAIAGGSSSGSAVAVAEGSARIGLGTDTGGSIRIPAALCGVVGFKPHRRTYCLDGVLPLAPSLDALGLLGRSVADVAAVHTVLDGGSPISDGAPVLGVDHAALDAAQPRVAEALGRAMRRLEQAGARLVPFSAPSAEDIFVTSTAIMFAEAAAIHAHSLARYLDSYGADVADRLTTGAQLPAHVYIAALGRRDDLGRRVHERLASVDAVIGPTVGVRPPAISAAGPETAAQLVSNTRLANLVDLAALSIPLREAQPIGVQLSGINNERLLGIGVWAERALG